MKRIIFLAIIIILSFFYFTDTGLFDCEDEIIYTDSKYVEGLGRLTILYKNCGATTTTATQVVFISNSFFNSLNNVTKILVTSGKQKIDVNWNGDKIVIISYAIPEKDVFFKLHAVSELSIVYKRK